MSGGLERLEGKERWNGPSNEAGHGAGERVEKVEKSEEENATKDGIGFGDLSALFKGRQNGILRELCFGDDRGEQGRWRTQGVQNRIVPTSLSSCWM